MSDIFNDILSYDNQKEEAAYFADTAMQYLSEIDDLKDEVANCSDRVDDEKKKQKVLRQTILETGGVISDLSRQLEQKDIVIKQLRSAVKSTSRPQLNRPMTPFVNPDEVTLRSRFIIQKIQEDIDEYKAIGHYENVEERITEVRNVFNLVMNQLFELHSSNKSVTKTLKALTELNESEVFLRNIKAHQDKIPSIKVEFKS